MKKTSHIRKQNKAKQTKLGRVLLTVVAVCVILGVIAAAAVLIMNHAVVSSADGRIYPHGTTELPMPDGGFDYILILGAGVKDNGQPSDMLTDRLKSGIALYEAGLAPKIIMSGDHGREGYDEVNTMKQFAIEHGVPSSDVFMDHAGFSTYESMYRAKAVFGVGRMIVVSQAYHLPRALYIADKLGIEAVGVDADIRTYRGQAYRDAREILARAKDTVTAYFMPLPKYLGDAVDVFGDGDVTNDR